MAPPPLIDLEYIIIRKGTPGDLAVIKAMADDERTSLGFVNRAILQAGLSAGDIFVATVRGAVVGFQHYHHRKRDSQTTLYRKVVAREWRRTGIATLLVNAVVQEAQELGKTSLFLKCPYDNASNAFHRAFGFKLVGTEPGKKRALNLYYYQLPLKAFRDGSLK